jgi:hypothetical protein
MCCDPCAVTHTILLPPPGKMAIKTRPQYTVLQYNITTKSRCDSAPTQQHGS